MRDRKKYWKIWYAKNGQRHRDNNRDRSREYAKTYLPLLSQKKINKMRKIIKWQIRDIVKPIYQFLQGKEYRENNQQKNLARRVVSNALKLKKLKKLPCKFAQTWTCYGRIEAHHPDYSQPLLLLWVCRKHHMVVEKIKNLARKTNSC